MKKMSINRFVSSNIAWCMAWLVPFFYFANIFRLTGNSPLPYIMTLVFCGSVGILKLLFGHIKRNKILWFMLTVLLITGLQNYFIIENISLGDIVSNVLYIGLIAVMFAYPMTYKQSIITFYISILVFIIGFFTATRLQGFLTSSSNYVSVILILATSLYYITIQTLNQHFSFVDLIPSLLCFFLSVWARGRGGIICSTVLLMLVTVYYLKNFVKKDAKRYFIIGFIMIGIIIYFIIQDINPANVFMSLGKLSNRGLDNGPREKIWDAYFKEIDSNVWYFFTGAPIRHIPIIHNIGDNTHNSFIHLHATNGIIPFFIIMALIINAMICHLKNSKTLYAIMLFVIFVRGMTDKFIFGQYGMPILMYLVLYPYFDDYIEAQVNKNIKP